MDIAAKTAMERCDLLGDISEDDDALTRPFGSPAMREVEKVVAGWMRDAGMAVHRDAIGNLVGRYEGTGEKTLILGSHLDTVRDAGRYDGQLGVLVALSSVQKLHDRGERLPFAVEVVAFADEEGLRFGTTYLGSSVYAGAFDGKRLKLEDPDGVSLREAVRGSGGDPDALEDGGRGDEDLLGYCEVHIEQGPGLEASDLPVGVVTAINGQSRIQVTFTGEAGHAGTVPIGRRKDALCAAAEFVLEAEKVCMEEPGAVATVGEISVSPGASNVIPGEAHLSLDLRHPDDAARGRLRDHLEQRVGQIAVSRGCDHSWQVRQETPAVRMDRRLSRLLGEAVQRTRATAHELPSGAGHDAAQMAALTPVAMLFVRCKEGVSHNPAESVKEEDVGVAVEVIGHFLNTLTGEAS
ncbi:MAG: allantoate amidohydrolase [Rubrobacteraceae bacterium]